MDRRIIEVELTARERDLILRYGDPFDRIERSLEACRDSKSVETVPIDAFELERLIGDLSISINDMKGGAVQNELADLCDRLEAAERYGDGQLDWL
jgi:hypothetical protein